MHWWDGGKIERKATENKGVSLDSSSDATESYWFPKNVHAQHKLMESSDPLQEWCQGVHTVCARKFQIILTDGSRIEHVCEINSWMLGGRIGHEWPMSWKEPGCTRRTSLWSLEAKAMNWTSCTKVIGGCPDDASSGKRPCRSLIIICGMGILLWNIPIFIDFNISCFWGWLIFESKLQAIR